MRLLIVATLAALPAVPTALASPASAGPCLPESYCPPCPYVLVIDGKNTHLEQAQC